MPELIAQHNPSLPLRLVALLFGLALALAVAELAVRLAGARPARLPLSYDRQAIDLVASGQAYVSFDAELGWVPTPNSTSVRRQVQYQHNHAGIRAGHEYTPFPAPGVRRYAAYGDSYTYCEEVQLDDCWTTMLEQRLPDTEVLNFGVPGYGPDQAWLRYQRDGAGWHPCAVLIGYMVEDIDRVVNRFRPFFSPRTGLALAKPRFVLDNDKLVLLPSPASSPDTLKDPEWVEANLGPRDAWYFPGTFVANPFDALETVRLARTVLYRRTDRESWLPGRAERLFTPGTEAFDVVTRILVDFAGQIRANGATAIVMVFPLSTDVIAAIDGRPKAHSPLLKVLDQHAVPTIDLTDALGRAGHTVIDELASEHYRPSANMVVARALARELPRLTAATCGSS